MLSGMKGKKKLLFLIPAVLVLGLLIWNIVLQVELKKYKPQIEAYLPEDVYFLVAHKDAVLMPYKIADAKVHEDPVGVSGALIEGRHYYDAYVLGAKCGGVYALVDEDCRSSAPTISQGKITAFGKVRYTLDGSDPRYSDSAKDYVAGTVLTPETGCKIRAYCVQSGAYPSEVAEG